MKALIMSGGSKPSRELAEEEASGSDLIIGVDKGIEYLYEFGMKPDILLGDFDSVNSAILDKVANSYSELLKYSPEKDFTDTQAAINKCIEMHVEEVTMLAVTGCRLDHTIANVGLLYQCLKKGIKACIKDDKNSIFMIDKNTELYGKKGSYFSLLAFGGPVERVNISGARYPLTDYNLAPWDNITISNEFCDEPVKITFKSGNLIIFYSKD